MFSTAWAGGTHNSIPLPGPYPPSIIANDDVTPLLNSTPANDRVVPGFPLSLRVTRSYERLTDPVSGDVALVMRFNLTALSDTRLGGFGFSLPADDNTNQVRAVTVMTGHVECRAMVLRVVLDGAASSTHDANQSSIIYLIILSPSLSTTLNVCRPLRRSPSPTPSSTRTSGAGTASRSGPAWWETQACW